MSNFCIDICVTTYKRPEQLAILLKSLGEMSIDQMSLRIIVIDNDKSGSAKTSVEKLRDLTKLDIQYEIEPIQGISYARNRALGKITAPYAAFLDDDEFVKPDWLLKMRGALEEFDADVVFGPVQGILADNAPIWAKSHPSFLRVSRITGTALEYGASNNVLFRSDALGNPPLQFDTVYAHTGGEDSDFFRRLNLSGMHLIWCDEAEVFEHVPRERATIKWVCRRSFRSGQTFYRIFASQYSILAKLIWFSKKILVIIFGLFALPFIAVVSFPKCVQWLCKVCAAAGYLSTLFGNRFTYQEYNARHYSSDKLETCPKPKDTAHES
jgi:succinoglycan biosynthesis protein ExoM